MTQPPWTTNPAVVVFSPPKNPQDISAINYTLFQAWQQSQNNQFGSLRFAFLFKPGDYTGVTNIQVGYYTSVMGLGTTPMETTIPLVTCPPNGGVSTHTFWRSLENFTTPASPSGNMLWAVSQSCPLRRIHAPNVTVLLSSGFSSGGFMADCTFAVAQGGTQQQWMSRNTQMTWGGGLWNMVFLGCTGVIPPTTHCTIDPCGASFTNPGETPTIAEKPYIMCDVVHDLWYLLIPNIVNGKNGPTADFGPSTFTSQPICPNNIYVADPTSTVDTINQEIAKGHHIILTPGVYNLKDSILVSQPVVILGIGFPTLVATGPNPCMIVEDNLPPRKEGSGIGAQIAGIIFQAGQTDINNPTSSLLQWGRPGVVTTTTSIGFLYDCFARVGGAGFGAATLMVQINSSNIICDNLWLWTADFGVIAPCTTGFQVNGDNVIVYGLAVEHTLGDITQWYGDKGRCYFYQSEFPYDVDASYGTAGFVSYLAEPKTPNPAYTHQAWGLGVYSFFRSHPVTVVNAMRTTVTASNSFTNALTKYLTGQGGISHVINGTGNAVNSGAPGPSVVPLFPITETEFGP